MSYAFNNVFGIVVYCEKHGEGAIVLNIRTKQPSKMPYDPKFHIKNHDDLLDCFNRKLICFPISNNGNELCYWEIHGYATLHNNKLRYNCLSKNKYDDYADGWKIEFFKNNIYDQFGNNLSSYGFDVFNEEYDV